MTPEKIHLALNHIPLIGLAFAIIPLLIGLIGKNRTTLISGLLIATLAGWATPFILWSGEEAYERYEYGEPKAYLDENFEDWLHVHEERAEQWSILLYATAVVATVSLILAFVRYALAVKVAWITCILCLASVGASAWIADSGGTIRRVEFRGELPEGAGESHEHEEEN